MRKLLGRFVEWLLSYEHDINIHLEGSARIPYHKYKGDAGYDLYCSEDVAITGGSTVMVGSGVYLDPKDKIWLEIKARSSTLKIKGLEVVDAIIDNDFRGEMRAIIYNPGQETIFIKAGDRLVQLVPHRLIPLKFNIGPLSPSPRGEKGYGSTGK